MTTRPALARIPVRLAAARRALAVAAFAAMMGAPIGAVAAPRPAPGDALARVEDAIERAVAVLLGRVEAVTVESLEASVDDAGAVVAVPEPGARIGKPSRFALWSEGRRIGTARATVRVRAVHVSAVRLVARGATLTADDVAVVSGDPGPVPIRLLPALEDVLDHRARRQIAPGEAITAALIVAPPAVRSGDTVDVVLRVGAVEVRARGVASGSGGIGDLIGVLTPGTTRPIRARIVSRGEVEVIE